MSTIIGGVACEDPAALYRECLAADPPLPTAPWWGRCNGFDLSPVGRDWGRGLILLKKSGLTSLGNTADFDLTFSGTDSAHKYTLKKITVLGAKCATPGYDGDENATYYAEVVDRRYHLNRVPIDRAYNVRTADGTDYLTQTKNGGSAWTWAQVVSDLASVLSISPGSLPFTPDGTPENLTFWGGSAWAAINDVLDRIACGLKYDPEGDAFTIVRLGTSDSLATQAQAQAVGERVWDAYPVDPERAWRPEKVRVRFLRRPRPTDGSSPWYTVDTTLAAASGVVAGTFEQLDDDASAIGATGTPTNSAALATRAAERAADWLRKRSGYERPVLKVYRDFIPDVIRRVPGATVGSVAIDDRGGPLRTEVAARPDRGLERWRPLDQLPPWFPADSGGGGPGGDGSWVAGLTENDCLTLTVVSASGRCADIDTSQTMRLRYDYGTWVSSPDDQFVFDGGEGDVVFSIGPGGDPKLTIGGIAGVLVAQGASGIEFTFGHQLLCGATPVSCDANAFRVRLTCLSCPIRPGYNPGPSPGTGWHYTVNDAYSPANGYGGLRGTPLVVKTQADLDKCDVFVYVVNLNGSGTSANRDWNGASIGETELAIWIANGGRCIVIPRYDMFTGAGGSCAGVLQYVNGYLMCTDQITADGRITNTLATLGSTMGSALTVLGYPYACSFGGHVYWTDANPFVSPCGYESVPTAAVVANGAGNVYESGKFNPSAVSPLRSFFHGGTPVTLFSATRQANMCGATGVPENLAPIAIEQVGSGFIMCCNLYAYYGGACRDGFFKIARNFRDLTTPM